MKNIDIKKDLLIAPAFFALIILVYFSMYLKPGVIVNASDVLTQQYFWEYFWYQQLHNSPTFAAWLPYVNGGTTLGGAMTKIFHPLNLVLSYLFPPHYSMSLDSVLHFWIMAIGTYMFARVISLSRFAAILSAVFFALSAHQVTLMNAGHLGKLNTIAWTPWVFWALEKSLTRRRLADFIITGVFLSVQLYEGHIQISFYVCVAVGIYFIGRTLPSLLSKEDRPKEVGKQYLRGVVMVLVFLSISASSLAHWLEFKGQSERGSGTSYEFATSWSMPKKELLTYVVPQMFGLSRLNYKDPGKIKSFYWGDMPFTQTSDYLGLLPLVLSLLALIKCRSRFVWNFLFITVLFQILAMGKHTPVYYFFYEYFGFKFFRVPKMNLFIVSFFVSIIAGVGANWLLEKYEKSDKQFLRRFVIALAAATGIFILSTLLAKMNQNDLVQVFMKDLRGWGRSYNPSLVINRYEYAIEGMWIACGFLAVCAGILSLRLVKSIRREVIFALMLAFFILDVSILNFKFLSVVPMEGNDYFLKDTAVKHFEKDDGMYRVLNSVNERSNPKMLRYLVPNKYILFNVHSVTGYEAVQMARYNDLLNNLHLQSRLLDLLNVKYIAIDKKGAKGTVGDYLGKFRIVVDDDIKILENMRVLPRAFPVHRAKAFRDEKAILSWVTNPSFNPRKVVLLEEPFEKVLSDAPRPESESIVDIMSYKNDEIAIDVTMAENGFVVLSEKYYPGWQAYLDDRPVKIYRADYALRAVYVSSGSHRLVVKYDPESYGVGLYITLLSLLLFGGILTRHCLSTIRYAKLAVVESEGERPRKK